MTHPHISMAVHNCARFSNQPTSLHEQVVERSGNYLVHTKDLGLIFHPDTSGAINMFIHANFVDTWKGNLPMECVLSRTGYVITYNGCPVQWGSKLQSEIVLSTTEAEYIALSMAARELIPLH